MKIIAHRGDSCRFPENTLASFRSAWACGADGVELDVRLTRDGEVVVFHDHDGCRLAGQPEMIEACDRPKWQTWRISGEPVPTLSGVLTTAPLDRWLLVELKGGLPLLETTLDVLHNQAVRPAVKLLMFDPAVALAAVGRGFPVWLNVEPAESIKHWSSQIHRAAAAGYEAISIGWSQVVTRAHIDALHAAYLLAAVWTVNDIAIARYVQTLGADVLMTDDPSRLREALAYGA